MSGETHTFSKCPFCQALTGIEIGTCPDGRMTVREHRSRCAGFEGVGTIQINYSVQGQYSLNRTAFLPNNAEGQRVLNLLRTAWDRRLCFAIGTSVTTGARNVPVWNVHHKTAMFGGVSCHGYPDPRYFERVTNELKSFGVEWTFTTEEVCK